jgi:hypothetical protein
MVGVVIVGPVATGGQIMPVPWLPTIVGSAPSSSPQELKYSQAVAMTISNAWLAFTATLKIPGLPLYPAWALVPAPSLPPTPNQVPCAFSLLSGAAEPPTLSTQTLKGQMVAALGDPQAPFHKELFESISFAFEQCYNVWMGTTMLNNIIGAGVGPGTPIVPAPLSGVGNMIPGGFS